MKQQLYEALQLTFDNAVQLFEDAELLEKNNRLQRAFTLYHISFEEAGRFSLITKNLFNCLSGKIKAKDLNYGNLKKQGSEDHIKKLQESLFHMFNLSIHNTIKENIDQAIFLDEKYNIFLQEIPKLNKLKNNSLYISFEDNTFKSPVDFIDNDHLIQVKTFSEIQIVLMKKYLQWIQNKGGIDAIESEIKST